MAMTQNSGIAAGLVAAVGVLMALATPAEALIIERFDDDTIFTTRCNGTACEKAVAEGRAGNQATNGDFELALGVPNTLSTAAINAGGGSAQLAWPASPLAFHLSYDAGTQQLDFDLDGTVLSTTVDLSAATGIFIRARGRSAAEDVSLSELTFNGAMLDDGMLASTGVASYLAFADFDTMADWKIAGFASLIGGRGSAPSFQIKLTDAQVVPIPAAFPLLASGLAGLAWMRRRRG